MISTSIRIILLFVSTPDDELKIAAVYDSNVGDATPLEDAVADWETAT
jgi:hypothetical protein